MTGPARLNFGQRAYVMGIINVTPDSFSGDGLLKEYDVTCLALSQARRFLAAGADILDIGGESTRPGAETVSAQEEIERVVPVIQTLKEAQLDAIISVDTYKAEVAAAALAAGADWINDVWGLMADADLGRVAAASQAPLILMHNRSKPTDVRLQEKLGGRYENVVYQDLIADIRKDLSVSVELALAAGVLPENIIIDPGIGFGKTVPQNLEIIRRLDEIKTMGYPLLLGPSRKSFIGYTLNLPPDQRVEGTIAACVMGIERGADILRVHDVEAVVRAVRMADAILRS
ncbi:MAG TPA: dihydropteroate synthase [Bellilinea sp.]|jgi:dihydropteroate synthase|nr:dihydropteroate synthase [Bellilinea sp.]